MVLKESQNMINYGKKYRIIFEIKEVLSNDLR